MNTRLISKTVVVFSVIVSSLNSSAQIITTFAGSNMQTFFKGGPDTIVQLTDISSVFAHNGAVYFTDDAQSALRALNTVTDSVYTIAGGWVFGNSGDGGPAVSAGVSAPTVVKMDNDGNIVFTDWFNNNVRKISPSGVISTIAGTGVAGYSGDGGLATAAKLHNPQGITFDNAGNLYIADDSNFVIRKVTPSGIISTIAGNGLPGNTGDGGPATVASIDPYGLTTDSSGNLIFADADNNVIRKISTTGIITTIAGNGTGAYSGDGGPATSAEFFIPEDVAFDKYGNLFIADAGNACIRKISLAGIITTVAGDGSAPHGYSGDGGAAITARLNYVTGVSVDTLGVIYIADNHNHVIRKVDTNGIISTAAGNRGYGGDGGLAINAFFNWPSGLASDQSGNIYISDITNCTLRKVTPTGVISIIAGNNALGGGASGDGGPAVDAGLGDPESVAIDRHGNIFIADINWRVRKVDGVTGIITTYAGNGTPGNTGDGGIATLAQLNEVTGVALDTAGNLFIADQGNNNIRRVDAITHIITTFAGPVGTSTSGYTGDGGPASLATFYSPYRLKFDDWDNLYIVDEGNGVIRKIDATTGIITTFAGDNTCAVSSSIGDGHPATMASLCDPQDIAIDASGNVFISCISTNSPNSGGPAQRIRKVTSTAGTVSTTTGRGMQGKIGDGGIPDSAYLNQPGGLCFDPAGNLYIADGGNLCVRKINYGSVGVPKVIPKSASIHLYPNPNNGIFSIEGTVPTNETGKRFTIAITDVLGQEVYHHDAKAIDNGLYVPVKLKQTLPTGVYYCRVVGGDTNVTLKLSLNR